MVAAVPTLKVPPNAARGRGQNVLQMHRQGCRQGLPGIRCRECRLAVGLRYEEAGPLDVATLGVLDAHTAVRPTFTKFALSRQTTVSPASSVGALHTRVSPIPDEGALGAVGGTPPHAVAIDSATVRGIVRLLAMARTSYQFSHQSAEWPVETMMADESDAARVPTFTLRSVAESLPIGAGLRCGSRSPLG